MTGGEATRITSGQAYDMQPVFSPDGKKLVFISDRNGSENVWVSDADGTKARALTTTERDSYMSPIWTPDGEYVIGGGGAVVPDEVLLSPDGRRAIERANRNVYMITVPPVGGVAPTVSIASSSSMPTWRLTRVGGDFIGWTGDSRAAYYSIGRSFFVHDLVLQAEVDAANRAKTDAEPERSAAPSSGDAPAEPEQKPEVRQKTPALEYEAHRVDVEIVVEKDKPRGVIALRNARLITMKGDEVVPRGDIVITDNRITAIGPSGRVKIPDGAVVRNLQGKTIMPGLVDIHAHTWVAWGVHRGQVSQFLAQPACSSVSLAVRLRRMHRV